ncbi:gas vesicle accessory protein GvpU [Pseudomonas sp. D1-36]|uniref:gas vesicle accessory protein GvpU n=1 Tax=Pseudomonas sp. D1-36 TaxID=2817387 RepID=UPI003DA8F46F
MTGEQVKTRIEALREQFGDEIYTKTKWEGRQTDWLIQWFANFLDSAQGVSIPMTFTVGGNLVSGFLISEADYFEQLASDFSAALPQAAKAAGEELIKALQPQPAIDEHSQPACQFVHLKSAQVFGASSQPVPMSGALWRGKISSVEGFNLGSLSQD